MGLLERPTKILARNRIAIGETQIERRGKRSSNGPTRSGRLDGLPSTHRTA